MKFETNAPVNVFDAYAPIFYAWSSAFFESIGGRFFDKNVFGAIKFPT